MQIAALNDPVAFRKRTSLSLPSPQVSDAELEEIVKVGSMLMPPPTGGGIGSKATQTLVGDYSSIYKPSPTPQRTPIQEDIIMQEARNLRALREMTPLNAEDLPELYEGTGFSGVFLQLIIDMYTILIYRLLTCSNIKVNPRSAKLATPNTVIGTPQRAGFANATPSILGTPLSVAGSSYTSSQTPLRDQFGLNNDVSDTFSVSDSMSVSSRAERERDRVAKARLAQQLKSLPEPEYTYEISIPDIEEDEEAVDAKPVDATEIALRQESLRREEEQAEQRRRSAVLRRNLPRPVSVKPDLAKSVYPHSNSLNGPSGMINQELVRLVQHDNYTFPNDAAAKKGVRPVPVELDIIDDSYIQLAREMVQREYNSLLSERGPIDFAAFVTEWDDLHKVKIIYFHNCSSAYL
jgi:pre-mRNA-splicing factor CDC5/CEF1